MKIEIGLRWDGEGRGWVAYVEPTARPFGACSGHAARGALLNLADEFEATGLEIRRIAEEQIGASAPQPPEEE